MQVTVCDVCKTNKHVKSHFFAVGAGIDAAGSLDTNGKSYDLCNDCYLKLLLRVMEKELEQKQQYFINRKIVELIRGDKK